MILEIQAYSNIYQIEFSRTCNFQIIQSTGSLERFLAFAAESTVPDVQQYAVSS